MKRPLATFALALSLSALGCDADRGVGPRATGLELEVLASFDPNNPGMPRRFTRVLRNGSVRPITLVVPRGCVILAYIENVDGDIVHPRGSVWGCLAFVATVRLAAGDSIVDSDDLEKGSALSHGPGSKITLPTGTYRAYAEVDGFLGEDGPRVQLVSGKVSFQVPH